MHEFAQATEALDSGRFAPQHLISDTVGLVALPTVFEALRKERRNVKF
jgi:(R,R)-butanediol dehydrogenase/meso-butanediol dehydrogenase/diacetyl reductase